MLGGRKWRGGGGEMSKQTSLLYRKALQYHKTLACIYKVNSTRSATRSIDQLTLSKGFRKEAILFQMTHNIGKCNMYVNNVYIIQMYIYTQVKQ